MLEFDEGTHEYKLNGEVVPSVTQCVEIVTDWSDVPEFVLRKAAAEGTARHTMVKLHEEGRLDRTQLDEKMAADLSAWIRLKADYQIEVLITEHRMGSSKWGYAGTCDVFGKVNGVPAVIDLKFGSRVTLAWPLQLAGYAELLKEALPAPMTKGLQRWVAHIRGGMGQMLPYSGKRDWAAFKAALTLKQWVNEAEKAQ